MKYGRGLPRPIAKDRTFHRIRFFCFGSRHAATVQHQEQQQEQHQKQEEQQEKEEQQQVRQELLHKSAQLGLLRHTTQPSQIIILFTLSKNDFAERWPGLWNTLIIQAAYARGVFSEDFPSIRFGFQHVLPYFCTHIIVLKLHARYFKSYEKKIARWSYPSSTNSRWLDRTIL